jgi:hypothetical protein
MISVTSNTVLHASKNSIQIAYSLPEYVNVINSDQSTGVKDNYLYHFISENKYMHMCTYTCAYTQEKQTETERISQWIYK